MFNFYNSCINKNRIKCSLNWGKSEVSNTLVYRWFLGKWSKARLFPRFSYARCIKNATNCVLKARFFIYVKCATFTCTNYNVPGTSSLARLLFELAFISLIPNANNNMLPPAHHGEGGGSSISSRIY